MGLRSSQTVLKLTCWLCGTNPSTLERVRARAHQICEAESDYDSLSRWLSLSLSLSRARARALALTLSLFETELVSWALPPDAVQYPYGTRDHHPSARIVAFRVFGVGCAA